MQQVLRWGQRRVFHLLLCFPRTCIYDSSANQPPGKIAVDSKCMMHDAGREPSGGSDDLDGTSGENSQGGAGF